MELSCHSDPRRDEIRRHKGRNGLDYVEVGEDALTLYVYFLGKLPSELQKNRPGLEQFLHLEGGEVIRDLTILDVDPVVESDPERDDYLLVRLDRSGDFASYTLSLVGVKGIDPHYASASFSFKIDCATDLDCRSEELCPAPQFEEPRLSYLAKDFASFRKLILDRLALRVPDWTEQHVPDFGVTLVELLAYVGDQLSYYQDAVATEAYLGTARQRISIRRHLRLVDYRLHEGCNARAWLHLAVSQDIELDPARIAFISGANAALPLKQGVLDTEQLQDIPSDLYEYFEPLLDEAPAPLQLFAAHNTLHFYSWGRRECCLPAGATSATILDRWLPPAAEHNEPAELTRALHLQPGEVLIFEEVRGARTGLDADADPRRRCAVRLTKVQLTEDPLYTVAVGEAKSSQQRATPLVEIEWDRADALPFSLCLSTLGAAPQCAYLTDVSVARGNVILIDHGRSVPPEPLPEVPAAAAHTCCECEGRAAPVFRHAERYRPQLGRAPLTHREPPPAKTVPAAAALQQQARNATAQVSLTDPAGVRWSVQPDLLTSAADAQHFVVEIDNSQRAQLRFGDGDCGAEPAVGTVFTARYRVGSGSAGNVGAEAVSRLVLKGLKLDGVAVSVRNPLPAQGGTDPEPVEDARLLAPTAFRQRLMRAIIAEDYARLAEHDARLQRAAARLVWTGSWYEADVAIDPLDGVAIEPLLASVSDDLQRYRRMGHDLHVLPARYVPIRLALEVCVLPGFERGHVKAALLARFSNRRNPDGTLGFFHPDLLSFGEGVPLSRIIAVAQAVAGVQCVTVMEFHRLLAAPNHELSNGLLPLAGHEIAQLDNDPNHPLRGQLVLTLRGGR